MSTLAVKKVKLGDHATLSNNFIIEVPAVANGTLSIKRESGTAVLSIAADGKAVIPGVVGTVAQVGGVVTGQVVERGSNANGEYVRFADGTQICHRTDAAVAHSANVDLVHTLAHAATFADLPICLVNLRNVNSTNTFSTLKLQATGSATQTDLRTAFTATQGYTLVTVAIGRWF